MAVNLPQLCGNDRFYVFLSGAVVTDEGFAAYTAQLIIMDNTLGRRLAEAHPNNKMIIAAIALRTCVVLFFDSAVLGYIKASIGFEAFFDTQAIIRICLLDVVMLGFCLFPLTHLKDYIYFYERAICYKGKIYLLDSLLPISWSYSALPIPVLWHQNQSGISEG